MMRQQRLHEIDIRDYTVDYELPQGGLHLLDRSRAVAGMDDQVGRGVAEQRARRIPLHLAVAALAFALSARRRQM